MTKNVEDYEIAISKVYEVFKAMKKRVKTVVILLLFGGVFGLTPSACKGNQPITEPDTKDSVAYNAVAECEENEFNEEDEDSVSNRQLSNISVSLPEFKTCYRHITADFCDRVSYEITVDFPKRSVTNRDAITKWLIEKIEYAEGMHGELPPLNAFCISNAKMTDTGWRYDGDIYNTKSIFKFASDVYFAIVKCDYGLDENDYPSSLFSILSLRAYVNNPRFVTFQQFSHAYHGGAHGYYTERLISFDPIHKQEINYKYMFKDNSMKEIIALLKEEARKSPNYQKWKPNIDEYVCVKDENDKPTGLYRLPQPGLSNEGVVFSFQPYEISCFAAGTFHFTIPYKRIKPYLTDKAKWCLKMV